MVDATLPARGPEHRPAQDPLTGAARPERRPAAPAPLQVPDPAALRRWRAGSRRFHRGAFLTESGAAAAAMYILRAGYVRVFRITPAAAEVTAAVLGAGEVVGVSALVGEDTWHAYSEALTPVDAWALPRCYLPELLREDSDLRLFLANALVRRLAFERGLLEDVALRTVGERARRVRTRLESVNGLPPRLTTELLAKLVAARRETVSRTASHAAGSRDSAPGPLE
jgi:CRP-like cAMP-binding protein